MPKARPQPPADELSPAVPNQTAAVPGEPTPAGLAPAEPFAAVPAVLRAALERKGFTSLSAVQQAVLAGLAEAAAEGAHADQPPSADDAEDDGGSDAAAAATPPADTGRDLQITSQTGSGKTVALGFAISAALTTNQPKRTGPLALILAPTRELAMQIKDELVWLFADLRHVDVDCVTGGTSQQLERQRLQRRPAVLVGTPGRLLDHASSGALSLTSVQHLVLDEADQMLDLGFRDELEAILEKAPAERRTHLVSATFPAEVKKLTRRYQRNPLHIEGTALGAANVDIEHIAHLLNARDRYAALTNLLLLTGDRRILVFVRTREDTTRLADQLDGDGFRALPLSGDLTQAQRTRTLAAFKRGTVSTLVATDVAARGLDVPDVHCVVHMDPPIDGATYTHRSGRTGRAGQKGTSILLVPRAQERAARRLCSEARVAMQWRPLPTAAEVAAARDEQTVQRVEAALATPSPAHRLAIAARLLTTHDATQLVAALLGQAGGGAAAPTQIASIAAAAAPPPPRDRGAARKDAPGEFVSFRINWGQHEGADPRRVLAHVCRRGQLPSNAVGAIDVGRTTTTFEVAAHLASEFARQVAKRDPRDPHLFIHRDDGGPRGHDDGPHGHAPRPFRRPPVRPFQGPGRRPPRGR